MENTWEAKIRIHRCFVFISPLELMLWTEETHSNGLTWANIQWINLHLQHHGESPGLFSGEKSLNKVKKNTNNYFRSLMGASSWCSPPSSSSPSSTRSSWMGWSPGHGGQYLPLSGFGKVKYSMMWRRIWWMTYLQVLQSQEQVLVAGCGGGGLRPG